MVNLNENRESLIDEAKCADPKSAEKPADDKGSNSNTISRRDFIKLGGIAALSSIVPTWIKKGTSGPERDSSRKSIENLEQLSSRKEHFKPFESGNAEWQYVEFQFENHEKERVGITLSLSELTNPITGSKKQEFLVMRHNITTQETIKNVYEGTRVFDEKSFAYSFIGNGGESLCDFSFDENQNKYLLNVRTKEFNSNDIDSAGLVLNPQGNLVAVSKDGNFTVAAYEGGRVDTNYFADHVRVETPTGRIVGYGKRDSENLEVVGDLPSKLDIDHNWVHLAGELEDGRIFYATAWCSKTGGDFRFADLLIKDDLFGTVEYIQLNEDDTSFSLNFESLPTDYEPISQIGSEQPYQMAHGGKISAQVGNTPLFTFTVKGNPGQLIDGKGFLNMVEAHCQFNKGSVLGIPVISDKSAIWETTDERYSTFIPMVVKQ